MKTWLVTIQQQLSRQLRDNKLPHALLFSGVEGAGQEEIAQWLINVLLCQNVKLNHVSGEGNSNEVENNNSSDSQQAPFILEPCGQCKTCKLFAKNSYPDHLTIISDKKILV